MLYRNLGQEVWPKPPQLALDLREALAPPEVAALWRVLEACWDALAPWEGMEDLSAAVDGLYLDARFRASYNLISRAGADLMRRGQGSTPNPRKLLPPWQAFLADLDLAEITVLLEERDRLWGEILRRQPAPVPAPEEEPQRVLDDLLYALDTPPEIAEAIMGAFRADVVLLALLESRRSKRLVRPNQLLGLLDLLQASLEGSLFIARLVLRLDLSPAEQARIWKCERYSLIMAHGPEEGKRRLRELGAPHDL